MYTLKKAFPLTWEELFGGHILVDILIREIFLALGIFQHAHRKKGQFREDSLSDIGRQPWRKNQKDNTYKIHAVPNQGNFPYEVERVFILVLLFILAF